MGGRAHFDRGTLPSQLSYNLDVDARFPALLKKANHPRIADFRVIDEKFLPELETMEQPGVCSWAKREGSIGDSGSVHAIRLLLCLFYCWQVVAYLRSPESETGNPI